MQQQADHVVDMNPRHDLPAVAQPSAQPQLERREHRPERPAIGGQYNADAGTHDAQAGVAGLCRFGFPSLTHLGEKIIAGRR